jgi:transposase InsO family protein
VLTEAQVVALEKAKTEKETHGEFESEHPGYCGAQDTFYVGNMKGVGRIYQQTFIDTYSKVVCAKLYDRKTPITAADLVNDRVIPLFESHDVKLTRILTDRGSEYCGNPERHEYELYLAVEDIDHSRTKTKSPQTNGICERFHKTVLNEFYRVAFRKKVYHSIDELQADLDLWSASTMNKGRIKDAGASAKRRCRPSLTRSPWRRRNSWRHDHGRQPQRLKQPTPSVRSSIS